ncbi:hypothetical protein RIF29_39416 [Crotalaria pallida]|uniref:TIR domain-containing protein n=1 Tax=Crotalaria pallida TaxID=3830 RepID=A0AAN9HQP2_CROPI
MSSSSSSESYHLYDVFLSFRGEDTRTSFTSSLYSALTDRSINTFMDKNLDKGTKVKPELFRAIEGSRISIVVFSRRYAGSRWCLDELVKIMECHRGMGQVVVPVFYNVDPAHVRHQIGDFGDSYTQLLRKQRWVNDADVLSCWKRALTDAANFVGWTVTSDNYSIVKLIVDDIYRKLDHTSLPITDFPVGLESRAQDVIQHLKEKSSTVRVIGIWGMGGSGKTTLAKAIYNQIHREFVHTSFLADIRELWETNRGQTDLQEQLVFDILKEKMKINSIEWGKAVIKGRLCETRVLVILDDVNKDEQIQALCGNRTWFGPGSVVIITTRDERVLNVLKADHINEIKEMDKSESLELFSWHAFREASPREGFVKLSKNVVAYCGGLPLALEVLGSYLYERTKQEWGSVLLKLEQIPNDRVQQILRISFDGLRDHTEKDIFLDICCFFIGKNRAYVTDILDGCGLHAEIGITVLRERSLIKIEKNNKLGMHDLLQVMGREIVRESAPKEPEKLSRLWLQEDVINVLTEHNGTKSIEGLTLKLQRSRRDRFSTKAFENMKRLRLLQLTEVQLDGDYTNLPKQLRWVYWQGFPLKYIPDNFYQGNLVAMDLRHSNLKLVWKQPQVLERLKILNLGHSWFLTNTPDFSKLPNLEKLILKDCPSLSEIHESIGDLTKLLVVNLKGCTDLHNLPKKFYTSKSLKTLIISGCKKIDKVEEDIVQMESLTTLIAKDTAVKQVPFSIVMLKSIGYISLCGFEGLSSNVFPSLIRSWMSPKLNPLPYVDPSQCVSSSLVSINIHSKNLGDLSSVLSSFSKLRSVCVQCCSEFQANQDFRRILDSLSDASATELEKSYALQTSKHSLRSLLIGMGSSSQVVNILSSRISQGLAAGGLSDFSLPSDNHPYWLTHSSEGNSILFEVPQVGDYCLKGMVLCILYSSAPENKAEECLSGVLIINHTKDFIQLYKRDTVMSMDDEEWQSIVSNLAPHDKVEIVVPFGHKLNVNKTALYLIYCESTDGSMEPSSASIDGTMEPSSESMIPDTVLSEPDPTKPMTPLPNPDQTPTRKNFWFWCNCFCQTK